MLTAPQYATLCSAAICTRAVRVVRRAGESYTVINNGHILCYANSPSNENGTDTKEIFTRHFGAKVITKQWGEQVVVAADGYARRLSDNGGHASIYDNSDKTEKFAG